MENAGVDVNTGKVDIGTLQGRPRSEASKLSTFMETIRLLESDNKSPVSEQRDYRVKEPWTSVMFIDGTQLARVNFALNSSARHSYIYIDAASGPKELQAHLVRFKKK